jgi:hypothetical protein
MTVGRAGVSRYPEAGFIEVNPHYKEWRLNHGVWVQEANAPDPTGDMAALVTEVENGTTHRVGDFYRIPGGRGVVALTALIRPKVGRPFFVVTANGNMALRSVFRLRPGQLPEITQQPSLPLCRTSVLPVGFDFFRIRVQVPDLDGLSFFAIATTNLVGNATYDANLNLGYHLSRVRIRYRCL